MELIAEVLFAGLGEILVPLLELSLELLIDYGASRTRERRGRKNHGPIAATFGYLLLGGIVGGISLWLLPRRLFPRLAVPGISLVLNPVVGGTVMSLWGRFRRARGHTPTNLATFHGGAAFAFGAALVRVIWVR